ncbi:MAG: hypothetical protein V7L29_29560 [Nostoc sp.]|uniref:hypothetical protein n=1 Tax=Nostoc sp. TaxID=1180 RepID=UPI002FFB29DD
MVNFRSGGFVLKSDAPLLQSSDAYGIARRRLYAALTVRLWRCRRHRQKPALRLFAESPIDSAASSLREATPTSLRAS